MKKVSIIIPIYNAEMFLHRCIDSVIRQSYSNIEVLLINDGSTDNSRNICEEFVQKDKRVKLINCKNGGVSYARNIGLENAKGEYIFFVDSDDWIEANTIQIMLNIAIEKEADIVKVNFYNSYNQREEKNDIDSFILKKFKKSDIIELDKDMIEYIFENTFFLNVIWGELINKNVIKDKRFVTDLTYGEDLLFNFQTIMNATKVECIKETYYHYLINSNGINQNYDFNILCKKISNLNYVYNEIYNQYKMKEKISIKYVKEIIDNFLKITLSNKNDNLKKKQIEKQINNHFFKQCCKNIKLQNMNFRYKFMFFLLKNKQVNIFIIYSKIFYKNILRIRKSFYRWKNGKERIKEKNRNIQARL